MEAGRELRRRELHDEEMAIANLTALTANLNRNSKKQRTPYKLADFCFFAPTDGQNAPDQQPADAYMKLIANKKLPSWALWIFDSMKKGDPDRALDPLALIGEGVVVLAPIEKNGGVEGLLLATSQASGRLVSVTNGKDSHLIAIPNFIEDGTTRLAREGIYLPFM